MEIKDILKEYKSKGFKISNNLMGASFLKELDDSGDLQIMDTDKGLFFLDTSNKINHLYYYINLDDEIDLFNHDQVIIEIIDKTNNRRNVDQVTFWEANGFNHLSENYEMIFDNVEIDHKSKFDLSVPNKDDYEQIISLYEMGLDSIINSYPSYDEYLVLIDNREIFIYKKDNKIVASITKKEYKNHYLLSHIIVDERCRGQGIGIDIIISMLENSDKKVLLWVSKDNINASKIYEKIGFKYTDKMSVQLIGGKKNDRK